MSDQPQRPTPPVAAIKPIERVHHGDAFLDEYEWLRDKADPEVIGYLEAENAYTEASTARLEPLRQRIFDEISTRTRQTDLSVPARRGGYWYYSRTVEGQQYPIHCRLPAVGDAPPVIDGGDADSGQPSAEPVAADGEQVLLDGNEIAAGSGFFALGTVDVSPDGNLLAYSVDLTGDERFTLRIKDLRTGEDLPDTVTGAFYSSAWAADGSAVFYLTVDDSWRPNQVWRHTVGADSTEDVVVHTEDDERFWVSVDLTRNQRAIQISIGSKLTTEVWLLDAHAPQSAPVLVAPRVEGVEYQVEHAGDQLLITHNTNEPNFELSVVAAQDPGAKNWQTLVPGSAERRLLSVDAFAGHAVLYLRSDGLTNLAVLPRRGDSFGQPEPIEFEEPLYSVVPGSNRDWNATSYRLTYRSMVTPDTVYDYDLPSRELLLRKRQSVLGGIDVSDYRQSREWARAADGTMVPLSVVRRADVALDGDAPVVLYGYGAYEVSIDPTFSIPRLSLLDRGVVFVIAHVRGGGELGRHWYDQGKMLAKRNTFTDFVAAAEHLVGAGWTRPERIVAQGGSAGGLLMGAVANLAPRAFGGIVAQVPFVDALTTILDPSLPLTVIEWEEWGNPLADPEAYAYMKSYTPYENVEAKDYPAILAVCGLNDARVLYVEPAKWVAKLRATATGSARFLLKTEMEAGHGGRSGRYDAWQEIAFTLAWTLDTLGVAWESEGADADAVPSLGVNVGE
ncbi:MAG TPA: S9 family peptidase [Jatrophihabitans sp.]|jgi:oligopeptidase B|uniref:S9 family peptidase n=1 Tax=Jatrophihabitans sp. TaxID=1932789 RepID=UPI002F03A7BE